MTLPTWITCPRPCYNSWGFCAGGLIRHCRVTNTAAFTTICRAVPGGVRVLPTCERPKPQRNRITSTRLAIGPWYDVAFKSCATTRSGLAICDGALLSVRKPARPSFSNVCTAVQKPRWKRSRVQPGPHAASPETKCLRHAFSRRRSSAMPWLRVGCVKKPDVQVDS